MDVNPSGQETQSTVQITQEAPPVAPKKSLRDSLILYGIIFCMLVVLGILGFEVYQYVHLTGQSQSEAPPSQVNYPDMTLTEDTPGTAAKSISSASATWKTYTRSKAPYTFDYPDNATLLPSGQFDVEVLLGTTPLFEIRYDKNTPDPDTWLTNQRKLLGEFTYPNWSASPSAYQNDFAIFVHSENPLITPQSGYIFKRNNAVFLIQYDREDSQKATVDKILSSLRFIQ